MAAKLGGASAARITFWLKLWDSAAFAVVAVVLDRLLRQRPAQRLRAHLLWTVNPLLLWDLVAAGHLDVLAVMAGLLGLLVLGEQHAAARPALVRVLAAGALLGVAADIKIDYLLFGLGAAWALRRSLTGLALAGAAALAVLVPSYAYFGMPAIRALLSRRNQSSADNFYRVFLPHGWHHDLGVIAAVLVVAVAILALRRLHRVRSRVPPSGPPWPSAPPGCSSGRTSCPGTTRCSSACWFSTRHHGWTGWSSAASPPEPSPTCRESLPPAQPSAPGHRSLRGPRAGPDGHAGCGRHLRGPVPARALEPPGDPGPAHPAVSDVQAAGV